MNYFENRFFSIGIILISLSAGITMLLGNNFILQIIGAAIALIGFISMMYGIRLENRKVNPEK